MDPTQKDGKTGSMAGDSAAHSPAPSPAHSADARERLMNDLKNVIGDVEQWLQESTENDGDGSSDGSADTKAQLEATLRTAKSGLLQLQGSLLARSRVAAQQADAYVNEHPWQAVGIGAAVGIIAGLLIARQQE